MVGIHGNIKFRNKDFLSFFWPIQEHFFYLSCRSQKVFSITRTIFLTVGQNKLLNKLPSIWAEIEIQMKGGTYVSSM